MVPAANSGARRANVGQGRASPFCAMTAPCWSTMRWTMGAVVVVRISLIAASWSVSYLHGASGA